MIERKEERIDNLIGKIARLWKLHPEQRLLQLLCNFTPGNKVEGGDAFFFEDAELEKAVDEGLAKTYAEVKVGQIRKFSGPEVSDRLVGISFKVLPGALLEYEAEETFGAESEEELEKFKTGEYVQDDRYKEIGVQVPYFFVGRPDWVRYNSIVVQEA